MKNTNQTAFLSFGLVKEALSLRYLAALLIMIAGTVLVVRDTLCHAHTHEHTHTFTHTHDGSTPPTYSHAHAHYLTDEQHGHRHSTAELEKLLAGQH